MEHTLCVCVITFTDGLLSIYDAYTGILEQSLPLDLVTIMPIQKKKRRFCFKIQSPQTSIQLEALSLFDMEEWMSIFTEQNN